jgi:ribosomal protein S26
MMIKMFMAVALLSAFVSDVRAPKSNDERASDNRGRNMTEKKKKPTIKAILGKQRVTSITKARQINVYHIKEFVTDAALQNPAEKRFFSDYEVLGFTKLDKKKSKAMTKVLLDANNYMDQEFINKCTFTGTIGLEIVSKKETVNVIVSYPCKKVIFIKDGHEFYRDLVSVEPLNKIAQELFRELPETE